MFNIKETIFGIINGMSTLVVSLIWEWLLQSALGQPGEATWLLLWLAASVLLMGIVLKPFGQTPNPTYILKQGLIAPFWIPVYARESIQKQ